MVAQRDTPPPPDTQAYKNLPAVSVSCILSFLFLLFLTYLCDCSSLVLAAMNSAVPSAGGNAPNNPTFGSEEDEVDQAKFVHAV